MAKRKRIKRDKSPLSTIVASIMFWVLTALFVYLVSPQTYGAVLIFFVLVSFSFLFLFSSIFKETKRGLIYALSAVIFIALRYFGVGNILNLLLLVGAAITIDIYLQNIS